MLFLWQRVNEGDSVPLSSSPYSEALTDALTPELSLGLTDELSFRTSLISLLGSEQSYTCLCTLFYHILRPYRGLYFADVSLFKQKHTKS